MVHAKPRRPFCLRAALKVLGRRFGLRAISIRARKRPGAARMTVLDRHWAASDANDFEAEHTTMQCLSTRSPGSGSAVGAFCFGCGYLTAFIVTRNRWRDEMIKRGVARYNWQTGTWEWGEPPKESRY
jgi:hypothetical protein